MNTSETLSHRSTQAQPIGWGAHHLRFTRLDRRTLDATDDYFRSNPWRGDVARKAQRWVHAVAAVYGIEPPTVRFASTAEARGLGCYLPATNEILMPKASATTLFHEFRHALQHLGGIDMVPSRFGDAQPEEDARAWSLSLFYQVRPERFRRMVERGHILYVPAPAVAEVG